MGDVVDLTMMSVGCVAVAVQSWKGDEDDFVMSLSSFFIKNRRGVEEAK